MTVIIERLLAYFRERDIQKYKEKKHIPEILKTMMTSRISLTDLVSLIITRCELAHFFNEQLEYMATVIRKAPLEEEVRKKLLYAVERNLDEELGKIPGYGRPHEADRATFLKALNFDYDDWVKKLTDCELEELQPATRFILGSVKQIYDLGPAATLTALWYWEHRLSRGGYGEFFIFLEAFEREFPEFKKETYKEGDELWWMASHADHDTHHAQLAADALALLDPPPEIVNQILHTMDSLFDMYWQLVEWSPIVKRT